MRDRSQTTTYTISLPPTAYTVYIWYVNNLLLDFCLHWIDREQHLEKKIEHLTAEAKAKMAKKDKKGKQYL